MTIGKFGIFRRLKMAAMVVCLAAVMPLAAAGQSSGCCRTGKVVNADGAPVAEASILDASGILLTKTTADGSFSVPAGVTRVEVVATHFAPVFASTNASAPVRVVVERPLETVVVSAYRSPLPTMDSPASTRVMSREMLQQSAPISLDGKLREVPGFELFRRSSSLVANPTTEGVSLRGLGSTAASRSLVLFDGIPLNDPYGGYIHWEEIPEPAIESVEVVRGGASDLYGSSAIGGVINILPVRPRGNGLRLSGSYGSEATTDDSALGTFGSGPWAGMFAGSVIATDGYTLIAPEFRGPIDQPSNVHAQNGLAEFDRNLPGGGRAFLRGMVLNESRHNGTPLQANGLRLWRYAAGADVSRLMLRAYGASEHYWQTFSSVPPDRASEKLTKLGHDPSDELGAQANWHQPVGRNLLLLVGADTREVRATDYSQLFVGSGGESSAGSRQRQTGVYGEALYTPKKWTLSGSARVDHFSNFDAKQYSASAGVTPLPTLEEAVFDPRIGVSRRLTHSFALNASAFRAYRAPTENELYRSFQVGQQVTKANPNLKSERATGWESGFQVNMERIGSTVRASYFWTQVNRPITALTLSATPTSELLQRNNIGQIESRGISLDYSIEERWFALIGGYQFADATVTKFAQEPELVGNWIPQVARNMATTRVLLRKRRWGVLSLQGRMSGRQFDDDLNQYLLHGYFRMDAHASHSIGQHVQVYADGENLFDREIEVGKTPLPTLGTPRVARFGLRLSWGD
ncbi:MAG: TonB-dependent receptor [Acidobacteriaceae bacterium]